MKADLAVGFFFVFLQAGCSKSPSSTRRATRRLSSSASSCILANIWVRKLSYNAIHNGCFCCTISISDAWVSH